MDKDFQRRLAGIGSILGLLVGLAAGVIAGSPSLRQDLLENTFIELAVCMLALGTVACLFWWARQSADPDRMAQVVAMTSTGLLVVLSNIIAPIIGWWGGPYFATRLIPLAVLKVPTMGFLDCFCRDTDCWRPGGPVRPSRGMWRLRSSSVWG